VSGVTELSPTNATSMMLSRDDVERLLKDDSPDSRGAVLAKVADHYNGATLSEREQEIAEHIFRLLMKDMSTRVRATLSERVKDNAGVPRDIVLHLANDVESVAAPVLRDSAVLSDADLVSIVEASHDMGKLLAVSQREKVSERVSGALVETNYAEVMTALLTNSGAKISTTDLTKIATDFADNGNVVGALTQYPNLPVTVVERLISRASDAVSAQLKQKYNLSDEALAQDSGKVRDDLMLRLLEGALPDSEMETLVTQMAQNDTLTPSIMMTALCRGQLMFFTMAMATMAKVPLANAIQLVGDRGTHGFNGIYQKSGLPESMMEAMRIIVRGVQDLKGDSAIPGSMLYANRLAERVVNAVGDDHVEYIPYFIALIRQTRK
jgi:uncharacterized protein (DUF2336 family)